MDFDFFEFLGLFELNAFWGFVLAGVIHFIFKLIRNLKRLYRIKKLAKK